MVFDVILNNFLWKILILILLKMNMKVLPKTLFRLGPIVRVNTAKVNTTRAVTYGGSPVAEMYAYIKKDDAYIIFAKTEELLMDYLIAKNVSIDAIDSDNIPIWSGGYIVGVGAANLKRLLMQESSRMLITKLGYLIILIVSSRLSPNTATRHLHSPTNWFRWM